MAAKDALVKRPVEAAKPEPSVEMERERLRMEVAEDIAAARGAHVKAPEILRRRGIALGASGDAMCTELETELNEVTERVRDPRQYYMLGMGSQASLLSGMGSHWQQRMTTSGKFGKGLGRHLQRQQQK